MNRTFILYSIAFIGLVYLLASYTGKDITKPLQAITGQSPTPAPTKNKPPDFNLSSFVLPFTMSHDNDPDHVYHTVNLWEKETYAPFSKTADLPPPQCQDNITPLELVRCRDNFVHALDAKTRLTFDRWLYLVRDKETAAYNTTLEQENWINDTLKKCKNDDCLEKAYTARLSVLLNKPYTLKDIIEAGLFNERITISKEPDNLQSALILPFLGFLSLFLSVVSIHFFKICRKYEYEKRLNNTKAPEDSQDDIPRPWHEVLKVNQTASYEDIENAYKVKIQSFHPDKLGHLCDHHKALIEKSVVREITTAFKQAKAANGWV